MPTIRCIFCDNVYDPSRTRGVCPGCGRDHPPGTLARPPDVFHGTVLTPAGRPVRLSDEEIQARQQASATLFTVAFLILLCRGLGLAWLVMFIQQQAQQGAPIPNEVLVIAIAYLAALPVFFALLGWWARYQPLPPALIGLLVYAALMALECVAFPGFACENLIINVAVLAVLIRAVQVAMKARPAPARRPEVA
jgi:hypothetical protein